MKTAKIVSDRPVGLRYLETSALLAALIEGDVAAVASLGADGVLISSQLTFVEARRAVAVRRANGRLDSESHRKCIDALAAIERRCDRIVMAADIVTRTAETFAIEPVRTLDSIHLASIESLDEAPEHIIVVTRDRRIEANARAMGYGVE